MVICASISLERDVICITLRNIVIFMCLESNWLFTSTKRVIHHDIVNIVIFLAQQAIEQKDANLNVTSILEAYRDVIQ